MMNMVGKLEIADIMKKIILGSLALLAFAACQSIETEVPSEKEGGKVPMTFVATLDMDESDTKLAVGSVDTENKKLTFTWKAGDQIAIYDNRSSTPNLFTATADGTSVSFSGSVTDGATKFIAIYPYSAAESVNVETGACSVIFPREQSAVAGSFDPESLVAVASADATDADLSFRLLGALLSFKVDFDDVVYVEFSGSRPMTGQTTFNHPVGAAGPSSVGTGTPNYKDVSISNADGSPLTRGETYYVSVRHTGSNAQEGFTAKLITSDAKVASRTGSSNLQIARKKLYPLGTFSSSNVSFAYDRCAVYNAGFDVTIAGKTYNKTTDGNATLLNDGDIFASGMSGIVFLDASATVTNSSEVTITSDVVLASNDPKHPATYIGTSGKSFLLKSGSLVLDNLIVDMSAMTSGQFMTKKDNESDVDALVIEHCDFKGITRSVYTPNSSYLAKGVNTLRLNGNRFRIDATNVKLIAINSGATTLAGYDSFVITNNVIYTASATALNSQIFDTSATITDDSGDQSLVMSNNIFYNIAASNGYFRSWNISSAEVKGNIAWIADNTNIGSNAKFLKFSQPKDESPATYTGSSSNNYCYGTLIDKDNNPKSWTMSDLKDRSGLTNVKTLTSNPIESFNTSTGEFTLVGDYAAYGPQL